MITLQWKTFNVSLDRFHKYLQLNNNYDGMIADDYNLKVTFKTPESSEDITYVNIYWNNITEVSENTPNADEIKENVRNILQNAKNFGKQLVEDIAVENILMGITQAGKTKAVADYCKNVQLYLNTGSLYAALNEMDTLIAAGAPSILSPFITDARMIATRAKIASYLGL